MTFMLCFFYTHRVYLLGSTPGRYQSNEKDKWGHLKLRKVLDYYAFMSFLSPYHSLFCPQT